MASHGIIPNLKSIRAEVNKTDSVLTIDQGNTKTKVSVVSDGKILRMESADSPSLETVEDLIADFNICGAIYCSVAGLDVRFIESLRHLVPGGVEVLTHTTPLPIAIHYETPHSLGLDRVAAAVAASALADETSALIVDAGTAITFDVIDSSGFRGGNIAPGIELRLKALYEYTGKLPRVSADGELPEFGYDTATAIRAGVVRGTAAEISAAFRNAERRFGVSRLFLSGGTAEMLMPLIKNEIKEITVVRDIVSLGLDLIFRYNDSINNENQ